MPDTNSAADEHRIASALNALLNEWRARATGFWIVESETLRCVLFRPADDLDPGVAAGFADATASVPRHRLDLGIVEASENGRVAVASLADHPEETGSGHWLRAFQAVRSIAVPLRDSSGAVRAVWAIAIGDDGVPPEHIAQRIRELALEHRLP